jgi:hypothetical protein
MISIFSFVSNFFCLEGKRGVSEGLEMRVWRFKAGWHRPRLRCVSPTQRDESMAIRILGIAVEEEEGEGM